MFASVGPVTCCDNVRLFLFLFPFSINIDLTKELLPVSEGQKHDGNAGDMNVMLSSASPSPTAGTKASEWLKASLHPLTL